MLRKIAVVIAAIAVIFLAAAGVYNGLPMNLLIGMLAGIVATRLYLWWRGRRTGRM